MKKWTFYPFMLWTSFSVQRYFEPCWFQIYNYFFHNYVASKDTAPIRLFVGVKKPCFCCFFTSIDHRQQALILFTFIRQNSKQFSQWQFFKLKYWVLTNCLRQWMLAACKYLLRTPLNPLWMVYLPILAFISHLFREKVASFIQTITKWRQDRNLIQLGM